MLEKWSIIIKVQFSFSEKVTKMCAIVPMVLKFTYLVNVKTTRMIAQIFAAFPTKHNPIIDLLTKGCLSLFHHSINMRTAMNLSISCRNNVFLLERHVVSTRNGQINGCFHVYRMME